MAGWYSDLMRHRYRCPCGVTSNCEEFMAEHAGFCDIAQGRSTEPGSKFDQPEEGHDVR